MKKKLHLTVALILSLLSLTGCSKKNSDTDAERSEEGFASPQELFEAMKANKSPSSAALYQPVSLYLPEDRHLIAYAETMMTLLSVSMTEDAARHKEAERAFEALIKKHDLTDRLEITDNADEEENWEEMAGVATKAFEGIDLPAFLADTAALQASFDPSAVEEIGVVSMKRLRINGDEATAIVRFTDETEEKFVFVRSDGSWFISWRKIQDLLADETTTNLIVKITFNSTRDLERATARQLLKGVSYDRSMSPELTRKPQGLQAYLEFWVPIEHDSAQIIARVRKVSGVKLVEHSPGADVEASFASEGEAEEQESIAAIKRLGGQIKDDPTFSVDLSGTKISDAEMEHLGPLTELEDLNLAQTSVGNAGLAHLIGMTKLRTLNLAHTKVSDRGLGWIHHLDQLTMLDLSDTEVTKSAVASFQTSVPKCTIAWNDPGDSAIPPEDGKPGKPGEKIADDKLRTWTNSAGKTLEAEFVGLNDGKVTLLKADGETVEYSLEKLSDADQRFANPKLRTWRSSNGRTLTAEFVRLRDGQVILRQANGTNTKPIPLKSLSDADQGFVRELVTEKAAIRNLRTWTSSNGKQTIEAQFASLKNEAVTLKDKNGTMLRLRLDSLSEADQKIARELAGENPSPLSAAQKASHEKSKAAIEKMGGRVSESTSEVSHFGCWLTRINGLIVTVDLSSTKVSTADLAHLKGLASLRALDLSNLRISEDGMAQLKDLTSLEWLSLAGTKVTERGMANVKNLTALRDLDLGISIASIDDRTGLTDDGLAHLRGLSALERLNLGDTKVTDAGLAHLKELTALESLGLGDTKVTDDGLVHLKHLTELKNLGLEGTKVTDRGLAHLKDLTGLEALGLRETKITDRSLAHLKGLSKLNRLSLQSTGVSDEGLAHLRGLSELNWLHLESTGLSDAGLFHLKDLTNLNRLFLSHNDKITDDGLVHLRGLVKMDQLLLAGTKVTDAGVQKLRAALPKCRIID